MSDINPRTMEYKFLRPVAHRRRRPLFLGLVIFSVAIGAAEYLLYFMRPRTFSSDYLHYPDSDPQDSMSLKKTAHPAPHQHVYYLKTHKTGSTTLMTILAEYCRTHELLPLLPKRTHFNEGRPPFKEDQIFFAGQIKSNYDMAFNHHVFTPEILAYLHNDSFTVTTLREPYDNFVSAVYYLHRRKQVAADLVWHALQNDSVQIFVKRGYASILNNRQSMDLGYNLSHSFQDDVYIKQFINQTQQRFQLVIITKYFDEGLVVLKRCLNWRTEDIVYLRKNVGEKRLIQKYDSPSVDTYKRNLHARFSQADILLYEHFLQLFEERMARDVGLHSEVKEFKNILKTVQDYCASFRQTLKDLIIPRGRWTNAFRFSHLKCLWLNMEETDLTAFLKFRQAKLMTALMSNKPSAG